MFRCVTEKEGWAPEGPGLGRCFAAPTRIRGRVVPLLAHKQRFEAAMPAFAVLSSEGVGWGNRVALSNPVRSCDGLPRRLRRLAIFS